MPWGTSDASRHTKKAKGRKQQRQWAEVANSMLESTGDEARAIRAANSSIARGYTKRKFKA